MTELTAIGRDVFAVCREEHVSVAAASLAYYAFNAVLPLLVLLFVGSSIAGELTTLLSVVETAIGADTAPIESFVEDQTDETDRSRAALIALGILLWSAFRTFRAVDGVFAAIYGTRKNPAPIGAVVEIVFALGAIVLALTGVALVLSVLVGVGVVFSLLAGPGWSLLALVLTFLGLLAVFLPVYYFLPDPSVTVTEALPGAAFAAATWALAGAGFRLYATAAESVQLYGAIGGILLFLSWLYAGGLALLIGVALNAVLADRVDPDREWLPAWAAES